MLMFDRQSGFRRRGMRSVVNVSQNRVTAALGFPVRVPPSSPANPIPIVTRLVPPKAAPPSLVSGLRVIRSTSTKGRFLSTVRANLESLRSRGLFGDQTGRLPAPAAALSGETPGLPSGAGTEGNPIGLPEETVLPGGMRLPTWALIGAAVLVIILFAWRR